MQNKTGIFQAVGFSQFCDAFLGDRNATFSYKGKRALFDYLENYSEETGEIVELDIVALCCDYTEYDSALDAWREYAGYQTPAEKAANPIEDITEEEALEYLNDHTQVMEIEGGGVIIAQF